MYRFFWLLLILEVKRKQVCELVFPPFLNKGSRIFVLYMNWCLISKKIVILKFYDMPVFLE